MLHIDKSFGANDVLEDVSFTVTAGEIVALLGENGAGKSTLMNILGGVLQPDKGQLLLDGQPVRFHTPADSMKAGIGFIHQEMNLINDLPIYETLFVGRELTRHGLVDHAAMRAATKEIFARMEVALDPETMTRDLDASYKQIVEIARALQMNARFIIMDEPTTSLTQTEIERVFALMRTLAAQGVGIIFISHKLPEVMDICDRYVVLRDGHFIKAGPVAETTIDELAAAMVGHSVRTARLQRERVLGEVVLQAEQLNAASFHDINFAVRKGEILGITGLLGDGRSELFLSLLGAGENYTGTVRVNGQPIKLRSPQASVSAKLGYVPRNRKENAIIADMDVLDNGTIVSWPLTCRAGVINQNALEAGFAAQREALRIKMGHAHDPITSLSGGNQQKIVLAKWLATEPAVLILDNPTQGVDVGAKEEIYDIISQLADDAVAVIVLSSEAQEIIRLCDRALVMYHGLIAGEVSGEQLNEHTIMALATGGGLATAPNDSAFSGGDKESTI
jgi:ribose transport system ATP-binding protein